MKLVKGSVVVEKNYKFYVIDDLNKNLFNIKRFEKQDFKAALSLFLSYPSGNGEKPSFGIENTGYSLDILHAVSGENILVTDYRMKEILSPQINSIYDDIEAIVNQLINDGVVELEYNKEKTTDNKKFKSIDKDIDNAVKKAESAGKNTGNKEEVSFEKE